MTGTVDERLAAALPPGPYRVEWPAEQGGLFTVWGRPKEDGGWAIPLVASGVQSVMEWLADHLNRLADSGVVLVEREALTEIKIVAAIMRVDPATRSLATRLDIAVRKIEARESR